MAVAYIIFLKNGSGFIVFHRPGLAEGGSYGGDVGVKSFVNKVRFCINFCLQVSIDKFTLLFFISFISESRRIISGL